MITPTIGVIESSQDSPSQCRSYSQSLTPSRFSSLMEKGIKKTFPNQPLYFISFAAAYCIQSMLAYSKEASALGPQYSNRHYFALIGASLFIALYAIYLLSFGCDGVLTIALSVVIGLVVGFLISNQNSILFGKESVNLLFLPTLRKSGQDFICVTSPKV